MLLFRLATTHKHSLHRAIPGAITTAILWQILQLLGTTYVTHVIKNNSFANSVFAAVIGMFAFIYLGALSVVLGAEVNVVKAHRLWPRALLTPFTDNVDLTKADRRAYADYAAAQRTKGFERVDVSFEHDGQFLSAKRRAKTQRRRRTPPADDDPSRITDHTSGRPTTTPDRPSRRPAAFSSLADRTRVSFAPRLASIQHSAREVVARLSMTRAAKFWWLS